ncbi:MAG: PAAR domain-containing protein [Sandaracinaceae bacterium]
MTAKPAARIGDGHACPAHGGGPLGPVSTTHTYIGGALVARKGDRAECGPAVDVIANGSPTVIVEGSNASREGDPMAHGGAITGGESSVLIGDKFSPPQEDRAKAYCDAMADGRRGNNPHQTYDNCGIEAVRTLLHAATGSDIDEDTLLAFAMRRGYAEDEGVIGQLTPTDGASGPDQRLGLLGAGGVPAQFRSFAFPPARGDEIGSLLGNGHGVLVDLDEKYIWEATGGAEAQYSPHTLGLTGVTYGPDGAIDTYIINDSITGCGVEIDAAAFEQAVASYWNQNGLDGPPRLVTIVTDRPVF